MNNIYPFCSVSVDEINHDLETDWSEPTKEERFEEALESLLSKNPNEYTDEAEYAFENFDVPLMLARYADTHGDDLEFGRQMREEIDNMIKAGI